MALSRAAIAGRLKARREEIGLTQAQVAESMGLHRPAVSEFEAGRRSVSSEELYQLARLYAVSIGELLSDAGPRPADVLNAVFRGQGPDSARARFALARFMERCREERELEELLGVEPTSCLRPGYRLDPPAARGVAIQQGEWVANEERRRLGLGEEPIRNPLELLAAQGVRIGEIEGVHGTDLDGVYFETEELGPCVGVSRGADTGLGFRAGFTTAHEYAHWLLNDVQAESFHFGAGTTDLREVRANAFAAAFLLPSVGLKRYFQAAGLLDRGRVGHLGRADIVRAMLYFGVSKQALVFRLLNSRLIEQGLGDTMLAEEVAVRATAEELKIPLRNDTDFLSSRRKMLALEAWRRGRVSTGRASDLCDRDLEGFQDWAKLLGFEQQYSDDDLVVGAAG